MNSKIREFLDSIEDPERRLKLEQMQWRIDAELRKYKDPVARMNRMCELFWDGVKEFNEVLNGKR
jgi:hypothetical protein